MTTTRNLKDRRRSGAAGSVDAEEIRWTFGWLSVVPFDAKHAFLAGQLEADLRRRDGVNQDRINALAGDILIAAVAKGANAAVVTQNVEDFSLFDGVSAETY